VLVDLTVARQRLEELRDDLDRSASTLEGEGAGTGSELSSMDQHPADAATDLQDADRQGAALDTLSDQRAQVEAALARLDEGTYGVCVDCGKPVSDERLDARPEAARCMECQTREEEAGGG
jgi:DnaK suppressor protein